MHLFINFCFLNTKNEKKIISNYLKCFSFPHRTNKGLASLQSVQLCSDTLLSYAMLTYESAAIMPQNIYIIYILYVYTYFWHSFVYSFSSESLKSFCIFNYCIPLKNQKWWFQDPQTVQHARRLCLKW